MEPEEDCAFPYTPILLAFRVLYNRYSADTLRALLLYACYDHECQGRYSTAEVLLLALHTTTKARRSHRVPDPDTFDKSSRNR